MPYCGVEWTGTLSGNSIIDGTYSDGYGVYCWFAERLLASTTYINDLTYTGESIVDPVEMTFTPIIEEDRDCFVVGPDADCTGVCFGDAVVDECGVCNGDGIADGACDCDGCQIVGDVWADCDGQCGGDAVCYDAHLSITNVDTDAGTLDIYMENEIEVSGFQFQLFGINITDASDGLAAEYFDLISSYYYPNDGYSLTLATSLTEPGISVIPIGEGLLIQISFTDYGGAEPVSSPKQISPPP
jgi:hypothetical protein